jgi:hypothetical protein
VDIFFDDLDDVVQPRQHFRMYSYVWTETDLDCLGPGELQFLEHWVSSRGDLMKFGHKERIRESYMLRSLF